MNPSDQFQAIVIGSGQGGNPLCVSLAQAGFRAALIERQFVGGTCVNYGCTPTKTMVASARVAYLARRGSDYGVQTGDIRVDMGRVRQRKRGVVESFRTGREGRVKNLANFELFFDSTSIMELDSLPEHLIVLGGGYVGLEFGQMFRRFGSRVTIVQAGPQLVKGEDADVAGAVAQILQQDSVSVLLNAKATGITK